MVATTPLIPVPTYEPAQYALTGLPFKLLPPLARYYLADVVGVTAPKDATSELINAHRDVLKCTFFRALQGNDESLIKEWMKVQKLRPLATRKSVEAMKLAESEEQFLHILLPERETHFREFVCKFDALIWLELEGRKGEEALTEAQQKSYRDEMCGLREALDYPKTALEALDRQVAGLLEDRVKSPVKTYFEENVLPVASPRDLSNKGAESTATHHIEPSWRLPRSHGGRRNSASKKYGPFYDDRKKRTATRDGSSLRRNLKSPDAANK